MRATRDDYELLGLNSETATAEDAKKAYRRLAAVAHPDASGTNSAGMFKALAAAYERIKDDFEYGSRPSPSRAGTTKERPDASRTRTSQPGAQREQAPPPPGWTHRVDDSTAQPSAESRPAPASAARGGIAVRSVRAVGRAVFLSGSWPATPIGVVAGLILTLGLGVLLHFALRHAGAGIQTAAEIAPTLLFALRVVATPTRFDPH